MKDFTNEQEARLQRRAEAKTLSEIEGYIFSSEDEAIFAMFERESFTDEQRRAYLSNLFTVPQAAE